MLAAPPGLPLLLLLLQPGRGRLPCRPLLPCLPCVCRREAPLLDALDDCFYSLREAPGGREAARLAQQFEALQKQASAALRASSHWLLSSAGRGARRTHCHWRGQQHLS